MLKAQLGPDELHRKFRSKTVEKDGHYYWIVCEREPEQNVLKRKLPPKTETYTAKRLRRTLPEEPVNIRTRPVTRSISLYNEAKMAENKPKCPTESKTDEQLEYEPPVQKTEMLEDKLHSEEVVPPNKLEPPNALLQTDAKEQKQCTVETPIFDDTSFFYYPMLHCFPDYSLPTLYEF